MIGASINEDIQDLLESQQEGKVKAIIVSHFAMNCGDLYTLQKILGHRHTVMTEKYAHLSPDYLQDAAGTVEFSQSRQAQIIPFKKSGS